MSVFDQLPIPTPFYPTEGAYVQHIYARSDSGSSSRSVVECVTGNGSTSCTLKITPGRMVHIYIFTSVSTTYVAIGPLKDPSMQFAETGLHTVPAGYKDYIGHMYSRADR